MHFLSRLLLAGGLLLGMSLTANAQTLANSASSAYPSGILTGSPYGANWSGYYGLNPGGYPLNTYYRPYNANEANYSYMAPGYNYQNQVPYAPRTTYYNSGYAAPGATYGSGMSYPGYSSYGYSPAYGAYNTYRGATGMFRSGGLFGGGRR